MEISKDGGATWEQHTKSSENDPCESFSLCICASCMCREKIPVRVSNKVVESAYVENSIKILW